MKLTKGGSKLRTKPNSRVNKTEYTVRYHIKDNT